MGIFVLILSIAAGTFCMKGLEKNASGELGLVYQKESVTAEQLKSWWEKAGTDERTYIKNITLSRNQEKTVIGSERNGTDTEAQFIETAGDMNLIIPGRLCQGSLAVSGDTKGCVVSRGLVEKLNMTGIGGVLECQGREYIIRGILDIRDEVCIVQGADDKAYTRVQIKYEKIPASSAVQMLAGLLPGEADIRAEGDLYRGLGSLFFLMPVYTLFALLMKGFRRFYRSERRNLWVREGCSILFPVLVLAGVFLLALWGIHFSDDYIPGAWSDFTFWSKLLQEKMSDLTRLMVSRLDCRDREMLLQTAGCLLWGCLASISLFSLRKSSEVCKIFLSAVKIKLF